MEGSCLMRLLGPGKKIALKIALAKFLANDNSIEIAVKRHTLNIFGKFWKLQMKSTLMKFA